jgi:hypothetical protein
VADPPDTAGRDVEGTPPLLLKLPSLCSVLGAAGLLLLPPRERLEIREDAKLLALRLLLSALTGPGRPAAVGCSRPALVV